MIPDRPILTRRERYCHQCGTPLPGPLAERMHACDDRPVSMIARRAVARTLPGKVLA